MGLSVWLDAATLASNGPQGTPVSTWLNRGSAGSVTVGGNLPTMVTTDFSNVPLVRFYTDSFVQLPTLATTFPLFIVTVARMTGNANGRVLQSADGGQFYGHWNNQYGCFYMYYWVNGCVSGVTNNQLYATSLYCDSLMSCRMWVNGALVHTSSGFTISSSWGLNPPTCGEHSDFVIGELMWGSVTLSDARIAQVHRYIKLKYGFSSTSWADAIDSLGFSAAGVPAPVRVSSLSSGSLRIGWNGLSGGGENFAGSLADLRIYARALSNDEIAAVSQPPMPSFPSAVAPTPLPGASAYKYACEAGRARNGATLTLTRSYTDGSWSASGVAPNCTTCPEGSYSFGGAGCSLCPNGATLMSPLLGCMPSPYVTAGESDSSLIFYLSGAQAEGTSAFTFTSGASSVSGLTYSTNHLGAAGGALNFSSGSSLLVSPEAGSALLTAFPSPNSAFTASAWIKCAQTSLPSFGASVTVFGWGPQPSMQSITVGANSHSPWQVMTLAGSGIGSLGGGGAFSDGTGTSASFYWPMSVAVDSASNIFVADYNNNAIRKILRNGTVTTIGTSQTFYSPEAVALDASGTVYVTDSNHDRIVKILPTGATSTLSGGFLGRGFTDGDGYRAQFCYPSGIAVNLTGHVFVSDQCNQRIRVITPLGVVSTIAGWDYNYADGVGSNARFRNPGAMTLTSSGSLVLVDHDNGCVRLVVPSTGEVGTIKCGLNWPAAVALDKLGNIYVSESNGQYIRKIAPDGATAYVAGTGSWAFSDNIGTMASFASPRGIAIDSQGTMYVADFWNMRIRIIYTSPTGGPCDSVWHHVATTYESGDPTVRNYVDGILTAEFSAQSYAASAARGALAVGGLTTSTSGGAFSGLVSELRVYNRALDSNEVLGMSQPPLYYANAVEPFPSPVATSYSFPCLDGFWGPQATIVRSSTDGSWSWVGGQMPNCQPLDCPPCPAGSFGPATLSAAGGVCSCSTCPAGTYSSLPGQTSCTGSPCAPGTFGAAGRTSASGASCSGTPCAAGFFGPTGSTSATAATCTQCPSGTYSTSPGSTSCSGNKCASGMYGPLGSTSAAAATCTGAPCGTSSCHVSFSFGPPTC
jgi:hypothetical protein